MIKKRKILMEHGKQVYDWDNDGDDDTLFMKSKKINIKLIWG